MFLDSNPEERRTPTNQQGVNDPFADGRIEPQKHAAYGLGCFEGYQSKIRVAVAKAGCRSFMIAELGATKYQTIPRLALLFLRAGGCSMIYDASNN